MRWWFMTAGLVLVAACSGGDDKAGDTGAAGTASDTDTDTDTDSDADADTDTDADTDADTDTDTDTDIARGTLSGTVVSGGGALQDNPLKLCRGLACLNEFTGSDGSFAFADVAADWHSFEIVVTDSSRATVLVPVQLGAEEVFSLDVNVPDLDAASSMPSSPTEVEMGEGLLLTISGGDIEPPLFVDPATEVAGVRVPQADWIPVIGATEVVDQWFLAPYHHKAVNGGLPIRFENLWKLKDGTSYEVWVASYDDSAWHSAGTVTVGGGFLEGGVLIDEVSTVALVVP